MCDIGSRYLICGLRTETRLVGLSVFSPQVRSCIGIKGPQLPVVDSVSFISLFVVRGIRHHCFLMLSECGARFMWSVLYVRPLPLRTTPRELLCVKASVRDAATTTKFTVC